MWVISIKMKINYKKKDIISTLILILLTKEKKGLLVINMGNQRVKLGGNFQNG